MLTFPRLISSPQLRSWFPLRNRLGVVAARESHQFRVRDKRFGSDAPEVDLAARKQIGQTAKVDAQHAGGAFTVIEE